MTRCVIFGLFLALAGCGLNLERPAVERQSYLIQPERPGGPAAEPRPAVLLIGRVEVAAPYDDRAWVYQRGEQRYETDFYNEFAADPDALVAQAAADWLGKSGLFRQVALAGTAAAPDYRLEAVVSALYVDFRGDSPGAVLRLRWRLVRESDRSSRLELDCDERVALAERSPAGVARAYRQALQQALSGLEQALAGSEL